MLTTVVPAIETDPVVAPKPDPFIVITADEPEDWLLTDLITGAEELVGALTVSVWIPKLEPYPCELVNVQVI